ncbi:MAG TPA: hypothetical protein VF572_02875 [Candidatus Saccharimonadales bacterium]
MIVVTITTPRRYALGLTGTLLALVLSACGGGQPGPDQPAPTAAATTASGQADETATDDDVKDDAKWAAEITADLKKQGWPIVGKVRLLDVSASGAEADFKFNGCGQVTRAVDPGDPPGVILDEGIELKPPKDFQNNWKTCPDGVSRDLAKRLKKQGFDVVKAPEVMGTADATFTHVKIKGCDWPTEMRVGYDDPLNLVSEHGDSYSEPPTDKADIKELCSQGAAESG